MSEALRRLIVHVAGARQGDTTITPAGGNEEWAFAYAEQATDDLALTMPRSNPVTTWPGILPPFEQHLPEMDLGLFPAAIWKEVRRDHAGMLWVAGQRRLGRLRFSRPGQALPPPTRLDLSLRDIADSRDGDGLLQDLLARITSLPGVSGVQPKLLVPLAGDVSGADLDQPKALADTHLLKGNRPEYPYATTVEAASLEFARHCGFEVPDSTLSADGKLLAVARFDLDAAGEPIGFDEACSLMGLWARDKYTTSCERLIKSLCAFVPRDDSVHVKREIYRRIAFNLLIENGDAHLKNWGLIYTNPAQARLAPIYDVLTTTCFEGLKRDIPALSLGGRKVWSDWKGFEQTAKTLNLERRFVVETLQSLCETLAKQLKLPTVYSERVPGASVILEKAQRSWQRQLLGLQTYLRRA